MKTWATKILMAMATVTFVATGCESDSKSSSSTGSDSADSADATDAADATDGADATDATDGADATDAADGADATDAADGSDGTDMTDMSDGSDGTDMTDMSDGMDGTDMTDMSDGMDGTDMTDMTDGTDGADGAAGKCLEAADQTILQDPATFDKAGTCGTGCLGQGDQCAKDCVVKETGLSDGCATCMADTINCAIKNCVAQCIADPGAQACTDCRAEFCTPAYEECAGYSTSE